jgi:hypothetical protein
MLGDCLLKLRTLAVSAVAVLAASATAFATSYSVSYRGTIVDSSFTEIINGQPYTVTVVVDNGNATAANQTWSAADLKCLIFRMNTGGQVAYAQDLAATNADLTVSGDLMTNGAGALTTNFDQVDGFADAGSYSAVGFNPQPQIQWYLNNANNVFFDNAHEFGDASGGVQMAIAYWSNPQPFSGSCRVYAGAPALSAWGEILLASLMVVGGLAVLRRRTQGARLFHLATRD